MKIKLYTKGGFIETDAPDSILTKSQTKAFYASWVEHGNRYKMTATVRYDDQCGNGHNSFAVTADIRENGREYMGGCCHEEIAKHIPELAPFIKWHLCSSDGPMHYIANTVYHAEKHGPESAHVYHEDKANGIDRHCVKYCDIAEAEKIVASSPNYTMEVDQKTAKEANYDHARKSAVWPEATDEELSVSPEELQAKLIERFPKLMLDFKAAVESLGFIY